MHANRALFYFAGKLGYDLYITADGDSLSSYTLYQTQQTNPNATGYDVGLYAVALFNATQTNATQLPVRYLIKLVCLS